MRKASIIAMAALALLTAQCKKNEPKPEEKVMVPITGSVDFGGSKTEITTSGMINPKSGDKIYIYYEGGYAGYMTCTSTTGQQFTCSGEIEQGSLGKTCTFMYLGTGSTEADGTTGISKTSSTISFANQKGVSVSDGKISGLEKFHVGSCKAQVSADGKVTLPMATKMSIAYFKLTDGTNPIANQDVTISGVSATATINKTNGTLTGVAGDITVHTDDQGKFYMALVPQSGEVTFTFSGPIDGETIFPYGIRECSFYSEHGSGNPLQVRPKPKFTVADGTTVEFAPGNLYWDGSTFRFEANQWKTTPTADGIWNASHVSHFHWSKTASAAYAEDYSDDDVSTDDVFFTEASGFQVNGYEANTWRTLTNDEWNYLLGYDPDDLWEENDDYGRPGAKAKSAWKELDDGEHNGLVILPDDTEDPETVMGSINSTADLATHGAVFLPAAGNRYGTDVSCVGSVGNYWSSTPEYDEVLGGTAYLMFSFSDEVATYSDLRLYGFAVRLVR